MFQQMLSLGNYKGFQDLVRLAQTDKAITSQDMPYFSNVELLSLCNLALDELARRMTVQVFAADKVAHGKELLEVSSQKALEALKKEFADALEELRMVSEESDPDGGYSVASLDQKDEMSDDDREECF
jgi:hypothetical protein